MSEIFRSVKQFRENWANTLYVDPVYGNNATGQKGRADLPFLTVPFAISAAVAGDTVYLRKGTYNVTSETENWFKDGVTIEGDAGVTVNVNVATTATGRALFNATTSGDVMRVSLPQSHFIVNNTGASNYFVFRTEVSGSPTGNHILVYIDAGSFELTGNARPASLRSLRVGFKSSVKLRGTGVGNVSAPYVYLTNNVDFTGEGLEVWGYEGSAFLGTTIRCTLLRGSITNTGTSLLKIFTESVGYAGFTATGAVPTIYVEAGQIFGNNNFAGNGTTVIANAVANSEVRIGEGGGTGNCRLVNCNLNFSPSINFPMIMFGNTPNNQRFEFIDCTLRYNGTSNMIEYFSTAGTKTIVLRDTEIIHTGSQNEITNMMTFGTFVIESYHSRSNKRPHRDVRVIGDGLNRSDSPSSTDLHRHESEGSATTVGATPFSICQLYPQDNSAIYAEADIVAINSTGTERYAGKITRGFYMQGGTGAAIAPSSVTAFQNFTPALAPDIVWNAGNFIEVVGTGQAGKTINWKATLKIKVNKL